MPKATFTRRRPALHRSSDVCPFLFAANIRAPRANIIRVYKRTFLAAHHEAVASATRLSRAERDDARRAPAGGGRQAESNRPVASIL